MILLALLSLYIVHKTVMAALYLLFSCLFSGGSEVATPAVVVVFKAAQNYDREMILHIVPLNLAYNFPLYLLMPQSYS